MLAKCLTRTNPIQKVAIRCFSTIQKEFIVISAVGNDRRGIVSDITKIVVEKGGNVGESQAAKLGSHFGLSMLISIPKSESLDLQASLTSIPGLATSCTVTNDPKKITVSPDNIGYSGHFTLTGADNPGIVNRVTTILSKHHLYIDRMQTSEEDAPFGGTSLFEMKCTATAMSPLGSGFNVEIIEDELKNLGNMMNCDVNLETLYDESNVNQSIVG